jgi:hypothetical protein
MIPDDYLTPNIFDVTQAYQAYATGEPGAGRPSAGNVIL